MLYITINRRFVAIFAAVISTPIAIFADLIIVQILAAQTGKIHDTHKVHALDSNIETVGGISSSLDADFAEFLRKLDKTRSALSLEQIREFDEMWGLDKDGRFPTAPNNDSILSSFMRMFGSHYSLNQLAAVRSALSVAKTSAANEIAAFQINNISDQDIGKRMLYLFQQDLLPGGKSHACDWWCILKK